MAHLKTRDRLPERYAFSKEERFEPGIDAGLLKIIALLSAFDPHFSFATPLKDHKKDNALLADGFILAIDPVIQDTKRAYNLKILHPLRQPPELELPRYETVLNEQQYRDIHFPLMSMAVSKKRLLDTQSARVEMQDLTRVKTLDVAEQAGTTLKAPSNPFIQKFNPNS